MTTTAPLDAVTLDRVVTRHEMARARARDVARQYREFMEHSTADYGENALAFEVAALREHVASLTGLLVASGVIDQADLDDV